MQDRGPLIECELIEIVEGNILAYKTKYNTGIEGVAGSDGADGLSNRRSIEVTMSLLAIKLYALAATSIDEVGAVEFNLVNVYFFGIVELV